MPNSITDLFAANWNCFSRQLEYFLGRITYGSYCLELLANREPSASFEIRDISECEVKEALKYLNVKKSIGADGIPSRLLKGGAGVLVSPLTELFNMTVKCSKIPREWKKARVVSMHKSCKKDEPTNFRPISILPAVSKILERLIQRQLVAYLDQFKILCKTQSGFRKYHSTETVVTHFVDEILMNMDRRLITGTVFVDFSKAFDTMLHSI